MADIYNVKIHKPVMLEEATSMGAAVTGGVGAGVFQDFSAIEQFITIDQVHTPDLDVQMVYERTKQLFEAFYQAVEPIYQKL